MATGVPAYEAVRNLLGRYCELIDSGDLEGLGELLAGAVLRDGDGNEVARGRDAVVALYRSTTRLHDDGTPRTRHVTANPIVEVDEAAGTATARSSYVVFQATGTVPLQPIVTGRYHDRFTRTPDGAGGWAFVERRIWVDHVGDVTDHLTFRLR
jgi:methyl coenzyme M reductase subunit C